MQGKQKNDYMSFLLRLSPTDDRGNTVWRISLESTLTRDRLGFGSIDELAVYLRQKMSQASRPDQGNRNPLALCVT